MRISINAAQLLVQSRRAGFEAQSIDALARLNGHLVVQDEIIIRSEKQKPRCPVCGVTGYRSIKSAVGADTLYTCRAGHPYYLPPS